MFRSIARLSTAAVLAFALSASAAPSTYTGILTDSMCTQKHMMPGHSDADCVRECVKDGAKYTLVSNGKSYELKGEPKSLDKYAGQMVKVTGSHSGSVIAVKAIAAVAD